MWGQRVWQWNLLIVVILLQSGCWHCRGSVHFCVGSLLFYLVGSQFCCSSSSCPTFSSRRKRWLSWSKGEKYPPPLPQMNICLCGVGCTAVSDTSRWRARRECWGIADRDGRDHTSGVKSHTCFLHHLSLFVVKSVTIHHIDSCPCSWPCDSSEVEAFSPCKEMCDNRPLSPFLIYSNGSYGISTVTSIRGRASIFNTVVRDLHTHADIFQMIAYFHFLERCF